MKFFRHPAMRVPGGSKDRVLVLLGRLFGAVSLGVMVLSIGFFLMPQVVLAAFGEDIEKPRPRFAREGEKVIANLVPRGKTASIDIAFEAVDGRLLDVAGMDFDQAAGPAVDAKDFRSALFVATLALPAAGQQAVLAVSSNYFNSSTAYWLFNAKAPTPWADGRAKSIAESQRVQKLVITVQDGGPWDVDGVADGRVTIVGGPLDSFWGYAIGTLFIRFFGVFLVLTILQIGMQLSGRFFTAMENRRQARIAPPPVLSPQAPEQPPVAALDLKEVAVLALALHMQHCGAPQTPAGPLAPTANVWGRQGRTAIMDGRRHLK